MDNKTLGYVTTTQETYYSNDSGEPIAINVYVCNTHTATVNMTLAVSSLTQGLSRGAGVPIFKDDMTAGEVVTYLNIILKHKQNLTALCATADKVTIKVDEV